MRFTYNQQQQQQCEAALGRRSTPPRLHARQQPACAATVLATAAASPACGCRARAAANPLQVKQFFVGADHKGDVPLHLKIASGLATGAIAITVASPTDLVKVRAERATQGHGVGCRQGREVQVQRRRCESLGGVTGNASSVTADQLQPASACCVLCCAARARALLQVRMQSEGKKAPGEAKKYPNAVRAYGIILR